MGNLFHALITVQSYLYIISEITPPTTLLLPVTLKMQEKHVALNERTQTDT